MIIFSIINFMGFMGGLLLIVFGLLVLIVVCTGGPAKISLGRTEYIAEHQDEFGWFEKMLYSRLLGRFLPICVGIGSIGAGFMFMVHPSHLP